MYELTKGSFIFYYSGLAIAPTPLSCKSFYLEGHVNMPSQQ
jgi:hypothetical protein